MKKSISIIVVFIICAAFTLSLFSIISMGDDQKMEFYVSVNSSEGEIYYRDGPGKGFPIQATIPNGYLLMITDISYNSADGLLWGLTTIPGYSSGWVSLRQTYIQRNGYPSPDFYVLVSAEGGSVNLRSGAGTNYQPYFEIYNGQELHIYDMVYNPNDGFFWGLTSYAGYTGYVSIRQTVAIWKDNSYIPESSYQSQYTPVPAADTSSSFIPGPYEYVYTISDADNIPSYAKTAFADLLYQAESDIRFLESLNINNDVFSAGHHGTVLFKDVIGDEIPEMIYFTVEAESGEVPVSTARNMPYTRKAVMHLATYDAASGRAVNVMDDTDALAIDDQGWYKNFYIWPDRYYVINGVKKLYWHSPVNWSGLAKMVIEYEYDPALRTMVETFSAQYMDNGSEEGRRELESISNANALTVSLSFSNNDPNVKLLINAYGYSDFDIMNFDRAIDCLR